MNIYILLPDANRYKNIVTVNEEDWELFRTFDGRSQGKDWKSPPIKILIDKDHKNRPDSDTPDFTTHIPVFSKRAVDVLRSLIEPYGEFLKLDIDTQELYAFNITKVVDALDVEKSEYDKFRDGKRIMCIHKHSFKESIIKKLPIFKLVQLPLMYVYVDEQFVEIVKKHHLTGFTFHPAHEFR